MKPIVSWQISKSIKGKIKPQSNSPHSVLLRADREKYQKKGRLRMNQGIYLKEKKELKINNDSNSTQ